MLRRAAVCEMPLFFYERGGTPLKTLLDTHPYGSAAMVIGPEGGFSPEEDWNRVIEVNLSASFFMALIMTRKMMKALRKPDGSE